MTLLAALGIAVLQRHHVALLLNAPYRCGYDSGCIDLPPPLAGLVMLGFDGLLLALAAWQIRASGLLQSAPFDDWHRRRHWRLGAVLLTATALAVRLLAPGLKQWQRDETLLASLAAAALLDGQLPLTGIDSSVHIPNPPASAYLLAPALLPFLHEPGALSAMLFFQAVFGAATSLLCAWFVRRWTGSTAAGLAAGLAYSLGFYAVFRSRQVWPPNFLPPFTVLFLDALLLLALHRRGLGLVLATAWLALLVQFHYLSVTLAPLLGVALWLGRRGLRAAHLAASALAAALLLAPFILWEVSFNTWFRDVREFTALGSRSATVDGSSLAILLDLASAGGADQFLEPYQAALAAITAIPLAAASAGIALLGLGLAVCARLALRPKQQGDRELGFFLAAWLVLPSLLLLRHSVSLGTNYFYQQLPAIAVVIGLGVAWREWFGRGQLAGEPGLPVNPGPLLLFLYVAGSTAMLGLILLVVQQVPTRHYGIPVGYSEAVARQAYEAWQRHGQGRPLLVGGHWEDVDELRLAVGPGLPVIGFDDCVELMSPPTTGPTLYVTLDTTPASQYLLHRADAQLVAEVSRPGSAHRVFLVSAETLGAVHFPSDARSAWPDCATR